MKKLQIFYILDNNIIYYQQYRPLYLEQSLHIILIYYQPCNALQPPQKKQILRKNNTCKVKDLLHISHLGHLNGNYGRVVYSFQACFLHQKQLKKCDEIHLKIVVEINATPFTTISRYFNHFLFDLVRELLLPSCLISPQVLKGYF